MSAHMRAMMPAPVTRGEGKQGAYGREGDRLGKGKNNVMGDGKERTVGVVQGVKQGHHAAATGVAAAAVSAVRAGLNLVGKQQRQRDRKRVGSEDEGADVARWGAVYTLSDSDMDGEEETFQRIGAENVFSILLDPSQRTTLASFFMKVSDKMSDVQSGQSSGQSGFGALSGGHGTSYATVMLDSSPHARRWLADEVPAPSFAKVTKKDFVACLDPVLEAQKRHYQALQCDVKGIIDRICAREARGAHGQASTSVVVELRRVGIPRLESWDFVVNEATLRRLAVLADVKLDGSAEEVSIGGKRRGVMTLAPGQAKDIGLGLWDMSAETSEEMNRVLLERSDALWSSYSAMEQLRKRVLGGLGQVQKLRAKLALVSQSAKGRCLQLAVLKKRQDKVKAIRYALSLIGTLKEAIASARSALNGGRIPLGMSLMRSAEVLFEKKADVLDGLRITALLKQEHKELHAGVFESLEQDLTRSLGWKGSTTMLMLDMLSSSFMETSMGSAPDLGESSALRSWERRRAPTSALGHSGRDDHTVEPWERLYAAASGRSFKEHRQKACDLFPAVVQTVLRFAEWLEYIDHVRSPFAGGLARGGPMRASCLVSCDTVAPVVSVLLRSKLLLGSIKSCRDDMKNGLDEFIREQINALVYRERDDDGSMGPSMVERMTSDVFLSFFFKFSSVLASAAVLALDASSSLLRATVVNMISSGCLRGMSHLEGMAANYVDGAHKTDILEQPAVRDLMVQCCERGGVLSILCKRNRSKADGAKGAPASPLARAGTHVPADGVSGEEGENDDGEYEEAMELLVDVVARCASLVRIAMDGVAAGLRHAVRARAGVLQVHDNKTDMFGGIQEAFTMISGIRMTLAFVCQMNTFSGWVPLSTPGIASIAQAYLADAGSLLTEVLCAQLVHVSGAGVKLVEQVLSGDDWLVAEAEGAHHHMAGLLHAMPACLSLLSLEQSHGRQSRVVSSVTGDDDGEEKEADETPDKEEHASWWRGVAMDDVEMAVKVAGASGSIGGTSGCVSHQENGDAHGDALPKCMESSTLRCISNAARAFRTFSSKQWSEVVDMEQSSVVITGRGFSGAQALPICFKCHGGQNQTVLSCEWKRGMSVGCTATVTMMISRMLVHLGNCGGGMLEENERGPGARLALSALTRIMLGREERCSQANRTAIGASGIHVADGAGSAFGCDGGSIPLWHAGLSSMVSCSSLAAVSHGTVGLTLGSGASHSSSEQSSWSTCAARDASDIVLCGESFRCSKSLLAFLRVFAGLVEVIVDTELVGSSVFVSTPLWTGHESVCPSRCDEQEGDVGTGCCVPLATLDMVPVSVASTVRLLSDKGRHRLISCLTTLLSKFNERVCIMVLGGGAATSGQVSRIMAKHMALSWRSIDAVKAMLRLANRTIQQLACMRAFERCLTTMHTEALGACNPDPSSGRGLSALPDAVRAAVVRVASSDSLIKGRASLFRVYCDYESHCKELCDKLVSSMRKHFQRHAETLRAVDWTGRVTVPADKVESADGNGTSTSSHAGVEPNAYVSALSGQLSSLYKKTSCILEDDALRHLFEPILDDCQAMLVQEYTMLDLKQGVVRMRVRADVELLVDTVNQLRRLVQLRLTRFVELQSVVSFFVPQLHRESVGGHD